MENISVIGIGKLGICFALGLEEVGYNVLGIDIDKERIKLLNKKKLVQSEPGFSDLLKNSKNFKASDSIRNAVEHSDLIFILVATPSLDSGRYDHKYIDTVVKDLMKLGKQSTTKYLVISSTVMPGYTNGIQKKLSDYNFIVSYNPEFIAQGSVINDQKNPDIILIGEGSKNAGKLIQKCHEKLAINKPIIHKMSSLEAEITKISLNCFLTTKIAYANMIGDIALKSNADPNKILNAVGSDSRIGNKYLKYGFGYGGPCFPRDNRAIAIYAKDIGIDAKISIASDASNNSHLDFQVQEYEKKHRYDKNTQIVFNTVTYKPNTTIIEESQQLLIPVHLAKKGYNVKIIEAKEVLDKVETEYPGLFELEIKS